MTDNRLSGIALIAGSGGMIITMALHPSGHVAAADLEPMLRKLIFVHSLALACIPVLFLGAWGLTRRLGRPDRLAIMGLVLYTFALIAVTNAAVADGLITPYVFRQTVASAGSQAAVDGWHMVSRYNFYMNQAFAKLFVAASCSGILLWSAAIWRSRVFGRGLGIYGFLLAPVTMIAMFSGHLPLDTHGFGAVVLGQAIWLVIAGSILMQREEQVAMAKSEDA